mmetsp:Transcript_59869/g.156992  ORF Transcript_59869/g.156992 Transcript_59869/m.156992 type:complete len:406 (-) Transcript_59869:371-1588(-)
MQTPSCNAIEGKTQEPDKNAASNENCAGKRTRRAHFAQIIPPTDIAQGTSQLISSLLVTTVRGGPHQRRKGIPHRGMVGTQGLAREAQLLHLQNHGGGHVEADLPKPVGVRHDAVRLDVVVVQAVRHRLGGNHKDALWDGPRLAANRAKGDTGEDVHVVHLPGCEGLATHIHVFEGRARAVDDGAVRPRVGVGGSDLRLIPGVREREDGGPLLPVQTHHGVHHIFVKAARSHAHRADQGDGLDLFEDCGQLRRVVVRLADLRELLLLTVAEASLLAVFRTPYDSPRVRHKNLRLGHTRFLRKQLQGAQVRRACTVEEEGLAAQLTNQVRAFGFPQLDGPHQCRNGHSSSALDVVVVRQELVPVLRQQRECVVGVEVLELQQALFSEDIGGCLHELTNETVRAEVC